MEWYAHLWLYATQAESNACCLGNSEQEPNWGPNHYRHSREFGHPKCLHTSNFVPAWNSLTPISIDFNFYFVGIHVHDSRAILFFHANLLKTRANFKGHLKANDFIVLKEWMEINHLCLISGQQQSKTVSYLLYFSQLFSVYRSLGINSILLCKVVTRTIIDGRMDGRTIEQWLRGRPWLRRTVVSILKLPEGKKPASA